MNRCKERLAGIILAAGTSTRMGKTKQLLPVDGGTLVERVLGEALGSELDKVVLVLGHEARKIKEKLGRSLQLPRLKIVENLRYKQGISTSIIAGLAAVEHSHDHVMILLGDMPHVRSSLINLLIRRYLASSMVIGAIKIEGRPGHPVVFSRELYPELHMLQGDVGARGLLRKYSERVCLVKPEEYYDSGDIDTPEDYLKY